MKTRRFLGLFLFLLVSLFAFGFNASVKAFDTSADVFVEGAQVRTTGNAGLRFVAAENVDAQEKTAFGIVLAFGEAEASENFVIGGTVNGKQVVNAEVTETNEGTFMVTLYDIPESMYKQKVSARAYVIADDEYVYAEEVCVRSLADVVIAAYEKGDESEFVKNVYESLQPAGTTLYYNNAEPQFASFDAFVKELVADFDAADPAKTVTKETFAKETGAAIKNVFNKLEMINKYRWLLEFVLDSMTEKFNAGGKVETYGDTYKQSVEMLNKILNNDTSAINGNYADARTAIRQVIYALINKTNKGQTSSYNGYVPDFTIASNYEAILPNIQASEVVELEENAALPANLIIPYYTFAGWYDNAEFEGEAVTNHNGASAYYAKFVPTTYTITYNLQGGATTAELVNEYTFKTETFALPAASTMSIENGEFVGWYSNKNGTGNAITEITKGTAGNIQLYAVWQMNSSQTLYFGETAYADFDAFVNDILADFKAAGASSITKTTFTSTTGAPIKSVFNKTEMINKYKWLIEFTLADLEENWLAAGQKDNPNVAGTYAESKELLTKLLAGDTSAINGSYANGRTYFRQFIHTLINKASAGHSNYDAYDYYISDFSDKANYEEIMPNFEASKTVHLSENQQLPTNLIKKGYTFVGWYDNAEFEEEAITNHNGAEAYYAKFEPIA